jgi:hypothetical protein
MSIATGTLYWDCNSSPFSKYDVVERLHGRLKDLRRRHGAAFLASAHTPEEMLERLLGLFFPAGRMMNYLACNITFKEDPFLMVRLDGRLPSIDEELPSHVSLIFKGYIDRRSSMFRVTDIAEMLECPPRTFERQLKVTPVRGMTRGTDMGDSALTPAWLQSLPLISKETAHALRQWNDYLEWKQNLVQAGIAGIRYISRSITEDGKWRFELVLGQSDTKGATERLLRSDDLAAYEISFSIDPWQFQYNENAKFRRHSVGDFESMRPVMRDRKSWPEGLTATNESDYHFMEATFALEDGQYNQFVELAASLGPAAAIETLVTTVPPTGFLANSAAGDLH